MNTLQNSQHYTEDKQMFMQEVLTGLSQENKQLSSKYFYDAEGSQLFNQITHHPDYYLTNCELEILNQNKEELAALFGKNAFNLVEFGPGEGIKTAILIKQFQSAHLTFSYFAVDISNQYLDQLATVFKGKLELTPLNMDYLSSLQWLKLNVNKPNLVLFLGSSIGNFNNTAAREFLQEVRKTLQEGDYFLIGFDLKKDIKILLRAYNDSDGLTDAFNLNILKRINKELNANFNLNLFQHYETYDVYSGAMESYLLSLEDQIVHIGSLSHSFVFKKFEPIHVESSYKYLESQIQMLAKEAGFKLVKNYKDSKGYFLCSLWRCC